MKLQKHLKYDQWKQDAPELNLECHGKGCEYLCKKIHVIIMVYCVQNFEGENEFNPFWNKAVT